MLKVKIGVAFPATLALQPGTRVAIILRKSYRVSYK
jgi:hypothetical protein